ncbi:MAG TPA: ChbG/HpnK family deacetylase [Candidatus Omnitrophota bacterium]|nr:ChbG/HpnK family deacetylase [Candidatus Omnitrophota bacterium]
MKQKILIVNADDCNLTPKVTEAILKAHQNGIVASTTFMINLSTAPDVVREVLACKKLGLGLHLNITLGEPVAKKALVKSLIRKDGRFKKQAEYLAKKFPPVEEISEEFKAQLQRFVKVFKRLPTHVDVHHHMHDHMPFFIALAALVKKHGLPVRWSRILNEPGVRATHKYLKTTDHFYGNLDPHTFWTDEVLRHLLFTLPEGTSEIMCHPGWVDDELCAISSLTFPREREYQLFGSRELYRYITQLGIKLAHFGWFRKK